MYAAVRAARHRAVGTKQALKAVNRGAAGAVYIAQDAEPRVVQALLASCRENQVPVHYVDSMAELGRACGIKVGAAAAALLTERKHEGGAELAHDQSTGA